MRLINSLTYGFEEFIGKNIPKYAILSHTWEEEEVSFKDMETDNSFKKKKGWRKIRKTCEKAAEAGCHYAWVDTCCIDKSSSAELSEAINSMYRWYQRAELCYVFLSDLPSSSSLHEALPHCRWFTRGWTLQELIAPKHVEFYDQGWFHRGSKKDLVRQLSEITRIHAEILQGRWKLADMPVATKMSWAARRETTRVEDIAYCLLGIFDVNMPLLYGEEEKSFRRLQEEIIKSSTDLSIFAWTWPPSKKGESTSAKNWFCSILADSPAYFRHSLVNFSSENLSGFSVSNTGIKFEGRLLYSRSERSTTYILPLRCTWDPPQTEIMQLGVSLSICGPDQFIRDNPLELIHFPKAWWETPRLRYLLTKVPKELSNDIHIDMNSALVSTRSNVLKITGRSYMQVIHRCPISHYDAPSQLFFLSDDKSMDFAAMRIVPEIRSTISGFEKSFYPRLFFCVAGWASPELENLQCSIVEHEQYLVALNAVQADFTAWDHSTDQAIRKMAFHEIPKLKEVWLPLGAGHTVVISFIPTRVEDLTKCRNKFWQMRSLTKKSERKN